MRIYHALCLGAMIAVSQCVLAELPISNENLGQTESALDFCSKVNSKSAAQYKQRGKALVGNASEKDLAKARSSAEYKDSYSLIQTMLEKLPKEETVKICVDLLESK